MIACHSQPPKEYKQDLTIRQKIVNLEAAMNAYQGDDKLSPEQVETVHKFAPGVYAREVHLPKGILLVGKLHRYEHFNFISKGKVQVITESGGTELLEAPITMISPAGTKRIVLALEDTVWTCIHPTNETDLEKIEHETIAVKYSELGLIDPTPMIESKGE